MHQISFLSAIKILLFCSPALLQDRSSKINLKQAMTVFFVLCQFCRAKLTVFNLRAFLEQKQTDGNLGESLQKQKEITVWLRKEAC